MTTNKGFNQLKEYHDSETTDYMLGGVGAKLKGLSDPICGIQTAIYAYPVPINGIYPRSELPFTHAIDVIPERKYLPVGTIQRGREDWMNCATNSILNEIERQLNYAYANGLLSPAFVKWSKDNGYINPETDLYALADGFNSILSGTSREGNSLKAPVQSCHSDGVIPKSVMPDSPSMDFNEYHDPTRITQKMKDLGQDFLKRINIKYQKVFLIDFPKIIPSPHWEIMDSYEDFDGDFIKVLAPDYRFYSYGYQIFISENDTTKEQISIIKRMINILLEVIGLKKKQIVELTKPVVEESPYKWKTPSEACHSVRQICDSEGLDLYEKTIIAQTINCESGFHLNATNVNTNGTTDWSLCQYNDNPAYGWIGENGIFKSPEDVIANPEKQVRTMIRCFKSGKLSLWTCYKRGLHEGYSPKV